MFIYGPSCYSFVYMLFTSACSYIELLSIFILLNKLLIHSCALSLLMHARVTAAAQRLYHA